MNNKQKRFNVVRARTGGKRPKATESTKRMIRLDDKSTPALMMDLMLGAALAGGETLSAIATEMIRRCGQEPIRHLALMATDRTNTPKQRVRLLDVIGQVGVVSESSIFMDLFSLIMDKNDQIRNAAANLIVNLRHNQSNPPAVR